MRRSAWGLIAAGAILCPGSFAVAQTSTLDAVQNELKDAAQEHQDVTTQVLANFFAQVDAGMASPDAAVALYQEAGGQMPEPAPVVSIHTIETPTERAARQAIDQGNLARLGAVLQLHCGMLHFGALFVVKPDQKGLQDDWVAWLKTVPPSYAQLGMPPEVPNANPPPEAQRKPGVRRARPFNPEALKELGLSDSPISKYLSFNVWGDTDQGKWAVKDLPKFYRTNILDPLRITPTADTLAAWDAFISMANADEPDTDKWYQSDYPPLEFERSSDDYTIEPSVDKLEALVTLIKKNPANPNGNDWITRVGKMMADYKKSHGGSPVVAQNPTPPPPTDPNVTVTTIQQGDAQIIITHTNSAPINPQP
jgi:hypothetical protein